MDTETKRIIVEDGLEAKIAAIIEPAIEDLGFRLVRVRMSAMNGTTLQIMADRPDGTMDVEGCEAVSRGISPLLDVEDLVDRAYHLEVSSPGIDRPLVRRADFEIWAGYLLKLETHQLVSNRKRFRGKVVGVEGDIVKLERDQVTYGEESLVDIPLAEIAEARLILTDDLVAASLKADKDARRARGVVVDDQTETEDGPTRH